MARASVFSLENGQDWKWSDDVERLNESKKERKAWEYSCYGFFFKKKKTVSTYAFYYNID